jgi:hypothetical protein
METTARARATVTPTVRPTAATDQAQPPFIGDATSAPIQRSVLRLPIVTGAALTHLIHAAAAWWANDPMTARFDRERAHDDQIARRNIT